ncbi:FadR/GntR family transcriptional regulator [Ammoniphilus sp. 3BR4]|uniref:FadR/GntR family transcriptional regulator n=1 Tax=Ammoniphilus sp. 3BR4 TaxID=3158265 RepID=UPI003467268F
MEVEIQKISNKKISELVAEQLQHWIVSGKVQPGEKLPSVRELCASFNVGRTAIRDAITTLKGKGFVDVRRGEGTFVQRFDSSQLFEGLRLLNATDIQKLFSVRQILEVGIAEMAARVRDPIQLDKMKACIEQMKTTETIEGWKADYEFHLAIAEVTQNEILVQLLETISATMKKAIRDCHQMILDDPVLAQTVIQQHEKIYEAIETGQADWAKVCVIEHLTYVERLLKRS